MKQKSLLKIKVSLQIICEKCQLMLVSRKIYIIFSD